MRIGVSLFLIAVGAILKFAVTAHLSGVDVHVVGVILIVVGVVGLLFDLIMWGTRRRTVISHEPGTTYISEPGEPLDRY